MPPDPRLESLKRRWEQNPDSRVFLQLAEEYRRAGKVDDAVEVLEAGLEKHPGSLAARVALGRCQLERGEPKAAAKVFEEVLGEDATHLVALKNLVLAYQAMDEEDRAREKLELYRALNPSDGEIEEMASSLTVPAGPEQEAGQVHHRPPSEPFLLGPVEPPAPDLWGLLSDSTAPGEPSAERLPAAGGGAATATLGRLYLDQGHLEEAEGAFREVLARDPDDDAAQRGIRELEQRLAEPAPGGDVRGRRAAALRDYLARIRRAKERS